MSGPITAVHGRTNWFAAVPPADVRLMLAVGVAGSIAGELVTSALWPITVAVVALLVVASRRGTTLGALGERQFDHFPLQLRRAVQSSLAELPDGDARRLLLEVASQGSALLSQRQSAFDEHWDRDTRRNVVELMDATCGVALDIARLDVALAGETTQREQRVADALLNTRRIFVTRLQDAAAAIAALHSAGVENGTPASDRVQELVHEIRAEAGAMAYARLELTRGDSSHP